MDRSVSLEALRINSGIGGVMVRLTGEELRLLERRSSKLGVSLPLYGLPYASGLCSSMLVFIKGLGARLTVRLLARLSERIRLDGLRAAAEALGESTCPPYGDAITVVPELVPGGGVGLSVRKRG